MIRSTNFKMPKRRTLTQLINVYLEGKMLRIRPVYDKPLRIASD